MERLTTVRRREIDTVHLKIKSIGDRMLNSKGILLMGDMSERERTHHYDTVGEGYKYFIEHGVHPVEVGLWVQACFQWIKQQLQVVDIGGNDVGNGPKTPSSR